jgi:hypothetical protein
MFDKGGQKKLVKRLNEQEDAIVNFQQFKAAVNK